jgi:tight adherence protein B
LDENLKFAVYLLFGVAAFLAMEALALSLSNRLSYARKVNSRLRMAAAAADQSDLLLQLRRTRSLTPEGRYKVAVIWFNRLVLQSGVKMGIWRIVSLMVFAAGTSFGGVWYLQRNAWLATAIGLAVGVGLPLLALKFLRRRRRRRFETQLPDAVDVMVRSLRAGHPLPVAIGMVSREMPDPIGSEFGLTADEMSYGLDLDTATGNMTVRVGQEDLSLVTVAISIQSKTGGNLGEILSNLSGVLRARFKMRRRIKALSAEGRYSALALSVLPFLVFGLLSVAAPNFYGEIWDEPTTKKALGVAAGIMVFGNIVMYRMVNFKL